DRVAAGSGFGERARWDFAEHGKFPEAVALPHEAASVLLLNDGYDMNLNGLGTLLQSWHRFLRPSLIRDAPCLHGTDQTARRFERADGGAEFHHRLIDHPRLGSFNESGGGIPQHFRFVAFPSMDAAKDATHIAVHDRIRLIERNAENRPGHVASDAG